MKVVEIMSAPLLTISSSKSVMHASEQMTEYRIGSLVVLGVDRMVGIITSRDARAAHPNRIVADAMTPDPISVHANAFAWEALAIMEKKNIERLVVTRDGKAVGIVTREAILTRLAEWKDSMTQMYRSSYIHAIGEEQLNRRKPFQLLFLDLNRFGEINKQFGHPVGDDLIRGYAEKLKSLLLDDDHACRYAGDEFAIITDRPDADVRLMIDTLTNPIVIGSVSLTASVGWLNDRSVPDFFQLPFRELLSRASLMSTKAKTISPDD